MRRTLVCIIPILVALSGCTYQLWAPNSFQERIEGFYLHPERDQLLVAGNSRAYRFDIDDSFKRILVLSRKIEFRPWFRDFRIDEKGNVSGEIKLYAGVSKLPDEKLRELKDLGFSGTESLSYSRPLKGKVYKLDGDLPFQTLDREYVVQVERPSTGFETVGRIVATPVAVAYDGAVSVPAGFLLVLVMSTDSW